MTLQALATMVAGADTGVAGTDQSQDGVRASDGDVLVVDDDGDADYKAIQAAVDAADEGTTIRVRPGTYREPITVEQNLTLVAPRGAILDGATLPEDADAVDVEPPRPSTCPDSSSPITTRA